ncbi:hypothetical protein, conserved [Eimeria tenella]|uniref:Uncharacterized protein n=1 Tax=Eimeria tenella TaxID=5802 RepID=U6KP13_EIMTE|nr:hypothetical protein, conserved [Eimeria tenella]CDJ37193.1 hypothetical protein, conserved [Eimeria tenella]|eukprot:XP_013228031.1 hypothetical protein, conserved [Eimeria tenella]
MEDSPSAPGLPGHPLSAPMGPPEAPSHSSDLLSLCSSGSAAAAAAAAAAVPPSDSAAAAPLPAVAAPAAPSAPPAPPAAAAAAAAAAARPSLLSARYLDCGEPFLFHVSSFSLLCQGRAAAKGAPPQFVLPDGAISVGLPVCSIRPPGDALSSSSSSSSSSSGAGAAGASLDNAAPQSDFERLSQLHHGPVIVYATKPSRDALRSAGGMWWWSACLFAAAGLCLFVTLLRGLADLSLRSGLWGPAQLRLSSGCIYTSLCLLDLFVIFARLRQKAEALRLLRVAAFALLLLQFCFALVTTLAAAAAAAAEAAAAAAAEAAAAAAAEAAAAAAAAARDLGYALHFGASRLQKRICFRRQWQRAAT